MIRHLITKERSPIVAAVKKTMPAVVSVVVTQTLKQLQQEVPELGAPTLFNFPTVPIPPDKIDSHGRVQVGGGSGFIVHDKGIILTNKHVISEPHSSYTVIMGTGDDYEAEVLASDPVDDVAILKIRTHTSLPVVPLGDSGKLELGQTVLAIGNALGVFNNTVSAGIISGLSRAVSAKTDLDGHIQEMRGLIQTDAAINPGNSGGPLIDIHGRAIGINTAAASGAQSIGFAIPIRAALRDLQDLEHYGHIRRPLLGIRYLTITPGIRQRFHLPADHGALVTREHSFDRAVIPGTPAYQAGVMERDIILEWNGKSVTPEKSIHDYLDECSVGDVVTLAILRKGKLITVPVKLMERK